MRVALYGATGRAGSRILQELVNAPAHTAPAKIILKNSEGESRISMEDYYPRQPD